MNKELENHLEYMYALERFGIKPGLEVTQQLLELVGNPHQQFKSIHVAGTNGKGSTAAFLDSALRQAGYKVGLYTSPHIYAFNERIQVAGEPISDEQLSTLAGELRKVVEVNGIQPTFFEFTTVLAFMYFAREEIDIAVVEVGLGGKLDSTNVITPLVSVITNIGTDHKEILGPTKEHIAREKAGIIKKNVPLVTAEEHEDMLEIFYEIAQEKNAPMYQVNHDTKVAEIASSLEEQVFEVSMEGDDESHRITIPLLGEHQITNASTALLALQLLKEQEWTLAWNDIQLGFQKTHWEGRLDVVSQKPLIIVDGAHNDEGVDVLERFISTLPQHDVLVFGVKKGRDVAQFRKLIIPHFKHVIITKGNFQPEETDIVAKQLQGYSGSIYQIPKVNEAVAKAKGLAPLDGVMVITGSLYMIADALSVLRKV